MGRVEHSGIGEAPVDFAFDYVADYRTVPKWMFGVRHFTPVGAQTSGVGAVFDTAVHLGPTTLKLRAEIIEWEDGAKLSLHAIKGIEGTVRWSFEAVGERSTKIGVVVDYRVPGGLAGRALDKIIQAFVGPAIRHTENSLREQVLAAYRESLDRTPEH
ncbi:SRPBCC family protein [Nocardia sp. NPDC050793]|uniref:SRPBCC family protein n=1 Tax=Nocardia sp. NPDC050793 TaxID=3155159 RepID=UPI0033E87A50